MPKLVLAAFSVILTLFALEGFLAFGLSHPGLLIGKDGSGVRLLRMARSYHLNQERRLIQFQPECATYDPGLTYTLIPSSACTVASREFSVEYRANRLGLRDDDASLVKPEIVVLGDSHAMGWGVAE